MPRHRSARTTVARGIYRDASGFEVQVCVYRQRQAQRFPLTTSLAKLREARDDLAAALRKHARTRARGLPQAGTFAADAHAYLEAVAGMPTFEDRQRQITYWVEALGDEPREAITAARIRAVLARWAQDRHWSPRTLNHQRTALMHLWHVLDGKAAPNPVRDVPKQAVPKEAPRELPLLEAARLIKAVAKRQVRSVLWLMLATGVTPTEVSRLTARSVRDGRLSVPGRRKGRGSDARALPLSRHGQAACRSMTRTGAWGAAVTLDQLNTAWRTAKRRYDGDAEGWRVYDLRHTYLSQVARIVKDERVVQYLAGHSSAQTTRHYTEGSVPDRVSTALLAPSLRPTLRDGQKL